MRTVLGLALSLSLIVALVPSSALAQASSPPPAAEPAPSSPPPTVSTTASTSATPGDTTNALTLWGIVPWGYFGSFGVGGRFMMPFSPIPRLLTHTKFKDYWALEFGADYVHYSYPYAGGSDYAWNAFVPVAALMWQVWFLPNLGVYPKAELGFEFGWVSGYNGAGSAPTHGGIRPNGAVGVIYKLDSGLSLRAESGYLGTKLGVAWQF